MQSKSIGLFASLIFLILFAFTTSECIANEQTEPVNVVKLIRSQDGNYQGILKKAPLRDVLRELSSLNGLEFYLHPQVKETITTEITNEDFPTLVKHITKGLNTAMVWVRDENAPGKYKISALYIKPKGKDTGFSQFEVIGKPADPQPVGNTVQKQDPKGNSSTSIYHPRPSGEPRPIIREERDGVETAYVADELLIRIDPGDNIDAVIRHLNKIVENHHGVLAQRLHRLKYFLARFPQGTDVKALTAELKKNNFVTAAEVNYLAKTAATKGLSTADLWHLDKINIPSELNNDPNNEIDKDHFRPAIAILDTGVAHSIPELQDKVNRVADVINSDDDPDDDNGHGTAMALLALQVAPDATIHAVKVMDENGVGTYADIAEGLFRALDRHMDVINLSLGGYAPSQILQDAIQYAHYKGAVVVAAVGNDGLKDRPFYPAAYANVIGVTAIDRNNQPYPKANQGDFVDLAAPGTKLSYIRDGRNKTIDGTSAAAALVAGAAAQVAADRYHKSPDIISGRLFETAVDIAPDKKDQITGYGLVNLKAALQLSKPAMPHEESFQPLPGIIPLDGSQQAKINYDDRFSVHEGEASDWLKLDDNFETDPQLCDQENISLPARIVVLKDAYNGYSISAANFNCESKEVQLYVLAGTIQNDSLLNMGPIPGNPVHKSLNLVTGFMPSGAAGNNKFIDTDRYGVDGISAYNGKEFFGTFEDNVQTYLYSHGAELQSQLENIPSHLLYSPSDFYYNNSEARLESIIESHAPCREGTCRPLILIHGWSGDEERWAQTLLMQNEMNAWWDFAEQNNQACLLGIRSDPGIIGYGSKQKGSDHLSYFEQNPTLKEQYKVYLFRYPTMRSNEYNAKQLAELIKTHPDLKDRTDIVLMGHSTGGLLAKYVTVGTTAVPSLNNRIDGVITLATPHRGSMAGYDYDTNFAELLATSPGAPEWLNSVIALGQSIAGFNLETDGALDLAWDGTWSNGNIPYISKGAGDLYAANTKLAALNAALLNSPATLDKFRFYGGWIETGGFEDAVEATPGPYREEKLKDIFEQIAPGDISIPNAIISFFDGKKGPNDNDNIMIVTAGTLSYLGLETDSVVSLPSSLLLAPGEKLSNIDLPTNGPLFKISGKRRIFYDRDHTQMKEPVDDKKAITDDWLFKTIKIDLLTFATPTPPIQSLTPTHQVVLKEAGTATFSVSSAGTTTAMHWTAEVTSGNSWLSIISGSSGSSAGTITFAFDANTSASVRIGAIRVTATGVTGSSVDVLVTQAKTSEPLWDVQNSSAWYYSYVHKLNDLGIVSGYPDGSYRPGDPVNRVEFIKMTVNALELANGCSLNSQSIALPDAWDVHLNAWYYPFIVKAYLYKNNNSLPPDRMAFWNADESLVWDAEVIRGEACRIVMNALKLKPYINVYANHFFSDIPVYSYHYPFVYSLESLHIIDGYKDKTFRPGIVLNRAEAAKIICNLIDYKLHPENIN
ncbi:MAG: S8 family serine peptidase [Desulfosalsimonadaceae bacterium]